MVVGHHQGTGWWCPAPTRRPRTARAGGPRPRGRAEALGPAPGDALDDAEHALVDGDEVRVPDLLRERRRRAVEAVRSRRPTSWSVPRCAISVAMARASVGARPRGARGGGASPGTRRPGGHRPAASPTEADQRCRGVSVSAGRSRASRSRSEAAREEQAKEQERAAPPTGARRAASRRRQGRPEHAPALLDVAAHEQLLGGAPPQIEALPRRRALGRGGVRRGPPPRRGRRCAGRARA